MPFVTLWVTKGYGLGSGASELSRKSDFVPSLCRLSPEPLTSWAPHGGHSLPGP
jgi:hypothetical protein